MNCAVIWVGPSCTAGVFACGSTRLLQQRCPVCAQALLFQLALSVRQEEAGCGISS